MKSPILKEFDFDNISVISKIIDLKYKTKSKIQILQILQENIKGQMSNVKN